VASLLELPSLPFPFHLSFIATLIQCPLLPPLLSVLIGHKSLIAPCRLELYSWSILTALIQPTECHFQHCSLDYSSIFCSNGYIRWLPCYVHSHSQLTSL